ncbi:hypothetical protein G7068_00035 [Leucobacter viscericola]|uniref:Uncharacterized protein n=1 Tax=Leucobacter viscericola TaxID=2714935 RepID=A0A6G7XAZ7_9MICO|nr:hypothetical protein [Leucobacter viscericola]QIK61774.1 hypothetical protein G7068_00035 [Leucobacter viscericola]
MAKALREFFQHERDTELGRWRWPEYPEYVVRKLPDSNPETVIVINESYGPSYTFTRTESLPGGNVHSSAAARLL